MGRMGIFLCLFLFTADVRAETQDDSVAPDDSVTNILASIDAGLFSQSILRSPKYGVEHNLRRLENEVRAKVIHSSQAAEWQKVRSATRALIDIEETIGWYGFVTPKDASHEKDLEVGTSLLQMLNASADEKTKIDVIGLLGSLRVKSAIPQIETFADSLKDPELRVRLLQVLHDIDPSKERQNTLLENALALPVSSPPRFNSALDLLYAPRSPKLTSFLATQILEEPNLFLAGELLEGFKNEPDPTILKAGLQRIERVGMDDLKSQKSDVVRFLNTLKETVDRIQETNPTQKEYQDAIRPFLLSKNSQAAYYAQIVFDSAVQTKTTLREQSAFVRAEAPMKANGKNVCESLCRISDGVTEWFKPEFYTKADLDLNDKNASWKFAMDSLAALFISKAAHYCPNAQKFQERILSNLLDPTVLAHATPDKNAKPETSGDMDSLVASIGKDLDPHVKSNLKQFTDQLQPSLQDQTPLHSSAVYGTLFYSLWLRETLASQKLSPEMRKLAENAQKNSEKLLKGTTDFFKEAQKEGGSVNSPEPVNSLFNTYAAASALMGLNHPTERNLAALKIAVPDPANPLEVSYAPKEVSTESAFRKSNAAILRGSVARAVTYYLLLYRTAQNPGEKKKYRAILLDALDNFTDFADVLLLNSRRDGTHIEPAGLAPYYFTGNLPYAAAAWRLLSEEKNPDRKGAARLKEIKDKLDRASLLAIDERGLATPQGKISYASSDAYVNPMIGLSLAALATECPQIAPGGPAGIVDFNMHSSPQGALGTLVETHPTASSIAAAGGVGAGVLIPLHFISQRAKEKKKCQETMELLAKIKTREASSQGELVASQREHN